jgi:DNA mismatch repair protein MutS
MAKPINTPSKSLDEIVAEGVKLTPMMEQYYSIRKNYPGIILMFRMGDFYELFFDDAKKAARLLNISLTHRGKLGDYSIPMAGMPHHAAGVYIDRLTAMGMKVAICDQIEDPKHAKGIVKRAVTQVVSPGMPYDLDKSSEMENSFMGSAVVHQSGFYLTLVDYTTGDFFGMNLDNEDDLVEKLNIYRPKEFITFLGQWDTYEKVSEYINRDSVLKTHLSEDYFLEKFTSLYIEKLIPTYKRDEVIKLNDGVLAPIGALSYYICSTQSVEQVNHFRPFQMISSENDMKITYPTLVGLEIFPKNRDNYKNSIVGFLDHTRTSMGTRKLKGVFKSPLRSEEQINQRHDTIDYLLSNHDLLESAREDLSEIRDLERIMAKVSTGKVNGGDLLNLARANAHFSNIVTELKKLPKGVIPTFSKKEKDALSAMSEKINITINDAIGANLDKGNLIKSGCNKQRDKLSKLNNNAVESLMELEARYRLETKIPNLKIKHNNVAGYFIEISKSHTKKIPDNFSRRQTLVNSERYQSPELAEFEKEMVTAKDRLHKLEREIFDDIVLDVSNISATILNLANAIALIDVYQSFAWAAFQEDFKRPVIKKGKKLVNIKQGWHPLIKAAIKDQFVKHDVFLDKDKFFGLITGPNMAGKTTVMREVAIIQFLTQVGCFVPAEHAEVGLCDYIFSRLGASDDIISGQSTFMVEMSETAEIIRHATSESLIILDEIGRGTSTYDGLSIAWSLVEYFVNKTQALTLFSTHYHELIDLVNTLEKAKNLTVKTINENGHVQFLYQLIEEGAAQSFGIHVAKLAGLPAEILERSGQILGKLEKNHNHANDVLF